MRTLGSVAQWIEQSRPKGKVVSSTLARAANIMATHHKTKNKFWIFIAIRTIANSMILLGVAFLVVLFWPFIKVEFQYRMDQVFGKQESPSSGFRELLNEQNAKLPPLRVDPVNTDYGIVIEKINVNAPIIADVNPADPKAYVAALKKGAAHAAGTADPGDTTKQNNNVFCIQL